MPRWNGNLGPASPMARGAKRLLHRLKRLFPFGRGAHRLAPEAAYRLWSETYDAQPGNVVLALERRIFTSLLSGFVLTDKVVVDIGCGTGRHWSELLDCRPRALHGVDTSAEMLARLRARHPDAALHLRTARRIDEFGDGTVDLVVSTLMLGHTREAEDELREWTRLLRGTGEILFTDFHPSAIQAGAKRTFAHRGVTFEVESHLHTVEGLRSLFGALKLQIVRFEEEGIPREGAPGESMRKYRYRAREDLAVPLVLGFQLRRTE